MHMHGLDGLFSDWRVQSGQCRPSDLGAIQLNGFNEQWEKILQLHQNDIRAHVVRH